MWACFFEQHSGFFEQHSFLNTQFSKHSGAGFKHLAQFLSTIINRIDRKGRVSVPASFRAALPADASGIVVFRALNHDALEGCAVAHLAELSASLDKLDLPASTYELIESTIFGSAVELSFDGEGRVCLPEALSRAVGINEEVAFFGRRKTFQLWQPAKLAAYTEQQRAAAKAQDVSLSRIFALAQQQQQQQNSGAL